MSRVGSEGQAWRSTASRTESGFGLLFCETNAAAVGLPTLDRWGNPRTSGLRSTPKTPCSRSSHLELPTGPRDEPPWLAALPAHSIEEPA